MKKICFLSGDITRSGGMERVGLIIANKLANMPSKYEVHILSLRNASKNSFFSIDKKIKSKSMFGDEKVSYFRNYFKVVSHIRKYIKDNKIDILIDVDVILSLFSISATRFTRTKLISWEHFNYYANLGVRYRDWARKLASKFSDVIITLTDEDTGYYQQNLNPKALVHTIYNPIIIEASDKEYSVDSKIILSAGRLTHQKGFDYLIDVANIVFAKHPNWKWLILGEGIEREKLENKIAELNLSNHVILEGRVSNIDDYYDKAAMFVLTSRYEGFGLVLTEAKSHKLPCVSFKCKAGPSEIVLNKVNGFLVDCFDIEEMADRVCELIENKELRKEFSDRTLEDTEKFDIENIIDNWTNLLETL